MDELNRMPKWYDEVMAALALPAEPPQTSIFQMSHEKEFERNLTPADCKMLEEMRIGL
jgi:hypothetical protein